MMDEDLRVKYLHGQPKDLTVGQKFRLILRMLRKDFPTDLPVRVRRVDKDMIGPDAPYGLCYMANEYKPKAGRYYVILISKRYPWNQQFETLIHEWAHCLTWHMVNNEKSHGDTFWRKQGAMYRKYIED
jgi:hypothetical protein